MELLERNQHMRKLCEVLLLIGSFVSVLFPVQLFAESTHKSSFFVHYSLDKAEYLVAEPIFVTITVENAGSISERYYRNRLFRQAISLFTSSGEKIPASTWGCLIPYEDPSTLGPGEVTTMGGNVLEYYGEGTRCTLLYLSAGDYTITAANCPSDTAHFRIREPESVHDKGALEVVKWASDHGYELVSTPRLAAETYSSIIKQYPNSAYVPLALYGLIHAETDSLYFTPSIRQESIRQMISEHPSFGYSFRALEALDPAQLDRSEAEELKAGLHVMKQHYSAYPSIQKLIDEVSARVSK